MATLEKVFEKLSQHSISLNEKKCQFLVKEVTYSGHRVNEEGVKPLEDKVITIVNMPPPSNVSESRAFLGMIQYYAKFMNDLSTTLFPLHELLKKNKVWCWTADAQRSFEKCKKKLISARLLVHYDNNKPLKLACDASSIGLGVVISHVMDDDSEHPIAFASRRLTKCERNYSQIEKEALSIIYGVKKFNQYLYGRKFTLVTDHKPLLAILGPKAQVPALAAARMQRWAILLAGYDYELEFRCSKDHANADALSRLPCDKLTGAEPTELESDIYTVMLIDDETLLRLFEA